MSAPRAHLVIGPILPRAFAPRVRVHCYYCYERASSPLPCRFVIVVTTFSRYIVATRPLRHRCAAADIYLFIVFFHEHFIVAA